MEDRHVCISADIAFNKCENETEMVGPVKITGVTDDIIRVLVRLYEDLLNNQKVVEFILAKKLFEELLEEANERMEERRKNETTAEDVADALLSLLKIFEKDKD